MLTHGNAQRRRLSRINVCALAICGIATANVEAATSFDEIQFWVGDGTDRAAMIIDWSEQPSSGRSLIWGFRFTGQATGADMLLAVLQADPRLYGKVHNSGALGLAVYGLGYDWNDDGALPITDGTTWDGSGLALVPSPSDGEAALDAEDAYAEGWLFSGLWSYATAATNPFGDEPVWEDSLLGASTRTLADGQWDAWTFAPSYLPAVPDEPWPAPISTIAGDYDRDDDVDGADLLLMQRTYAASAVPPGAGADGDRSGVIDGGDLSLWVQEIGNGGAASVPAHATVVPEPTANRLALLSLLIAAARGALASSDSKAAARTTAARCSRVRLSLPV